MTTPQSKSPSRTFLVLLTRLIKFVEAADVISIFSNYKMAITRSRQQVTRPTATSRRAAATCLCLRPVKTGKRAVKLQAVKKLERGERREALKKAEEATKQAKELTGRRLLLYLPLEIHYMKKLDWKNCGPFHRGPWKWIREGEWGTGNTVAQDHHPVTC